MWIKGKKKENSMWYRRNPRIWYEIISDRFEKPYSDVTHLWRCNHTLFRNLRRSPSAFRKHYEIWRWPCKDWDQIRGQCIVGFKRATEIGKDEKEKKGTKEERKERKLCLSRWITSPETTLTTTTTTTTVPLLQFILYIFNNVLVEPKPEA